MESLPLSILAFAAGVYLLIKVKREYLGSLFSVLAWLVIVASLVSIGFSTAECIDDCCEDERGCRMEKEIIIKDSEGGRCHGMSESACHMKGCKMEGDSCVMDKEACEKMMGKEACDAMYNERGRCIMSKDECMKMCHGMKAEGGCARHHEGSMREGKGGCCMGKSEKGKCSHPKGTE